MASLETFQETSLFRVTWMGAGGEARVSAQKMEMGNHGGGVISPKRHTRY